MDVVRQAAKHTHDPNVFLTAANFMAGKWGGSALAYVALAETAARLTRDRSGEAMYAWLAYQTPYLLEPEEQVDAKFEWDRVRKGAEDIIRLAPTWVPGYHRLAWLARRFNDRAVAREVFKRAELDWYEGAEGVWGSFGTYREARLWALRPPAEAFVDVPVGTIAWPRIALGSEAVIGETTRRQITTVLAGAKQGVVAVSAMPRLPDPDSPRGHFRPDRRLTRWTIRPAAGSKQIVEATVLKLPPESGERYGVALSVAKPDAIPAHVLKVAPRGSHVPQLRSRVFVVTCSWSPSGCAQEVLEGTVAAITEGRSYSIAFGREIDPISLLGAAVLDEDGHLRAVLNGRTTIGGHEAELIEAILPP